jgi:hypothetical protein
MATYHVSVVVVYNYEVEAIDTDDATNQGWQYEDYPEYAEVEVIDVELISDDEDEKGDE